MNSAIMRIEVRLINKGLEADLRRFEAALARFGNAAVTSGKKVQTSLGTRLRNASQHLVKFGKDLQWTGRQLEYRFTLPLVLAGIAAGRWALANETAMTRLRKVYGAAGEGTAKFSREIATLQRGFVALSSIFGVQQSEVIAIGAIWAQAGAQGIALARATRLTLEAMILGEFTYEAAAKALLVLRAQFGLTTKELKRSLSMLNVIENETATNFADLVDAIVRGGGAARSAGVDLRHFAAMVTALVPATGTAAVAGNALKTIISRMMAPTKEAADVMAELGINTEDVGWTSLNAVERLTRLAEAYKTLTPAQRAYASSVIGSRWQVARFDVLLRELLNPMGMYAKALKASENPARNLTQYVRELGIYLSSQPQSFKILTTQLQNMLAQVIVPLLPAILALMSKLTELVHWFTSLSPAVQQLVLGGLALLAILGPLIAYMGSFAILFGEFGKLIMLTAKGFGFLLSGVGLLRVGLLAAGKALFVFLTSNPIGWFLLLAAAVAALAYAFRGELGDAFRWLRENFDEIPGMIGDAWNKALDYTKQALSNFPLAVKNAFVAVVQIVKAAALAVYEWLSYLNPFAHHSPSLVEQVTAGVELIASRYASLSGIGRAFRQAIGDFAAFKNAVSAAQDAARSQEFADMRVDVVSASPGAGGAFDAVLWSIRPLEAALSAIGAEFAAQEHTVASWAARLAAANATLATATDRLDDLRAVADGLSDTLGAANERLSTLASTPITGMQAMSDAIFKNEMAQKRLRLELLKMETAGQSIDDIRSKMNELNGELEMLYGRREQLRLGGAGSDVLGSLDSMIADLKSQQGGLGSAAGEVQALNDRLAELERRGEMLDLENSLKFDPLRRQIEQVTNAVEEVPFPELLRQIKEQQREVHRLENAWTAADEAVRAQQGVVDSLAARRDAVQATYDIEKQRLDDLGTSYDAVEQQIREMEDALRSFASAAASASGAGGGGGDSAFAAAGAGSFATPGGNADFSTPESGDLDALVDQWAKEAQTAFGSFDILGPFKDAWNKSWAWVKQASVDAWSSISAWVGGVDWAGMWAPISSGIKDVMPEGGFGSIFQKFMASDAIQGVVGGLADIFDTLRGAVSWANENVIPFFSDLWTHVVDAGKNIGGELKNWGSLFEPLKEAFGHTWNAIATGLRWVFSIVNVVLGAILGIFWFVWPAIANVVTAVVDFLGEAIRAGLEIVRGIISFVLAIINGDWGKAWDAICTILDGVWDLIVATLRAVGRIVWGVLKGLGERVVEVIKWLADKSLEVFVALLEWFVALPGKVVEALGDFGGFVWRKIKKGFDALKDSLHKILDKVIDFFKDLPGDVVDVLGNIGKFIWNAIKAGFRALKGSIKDILGAVIGFFGDLPGNIVEAAGNVGEFLWENFKEGLGIFKDSVEGIVEDVIQFFRDLPGNIVDAASAIYDKALEIGGKITSGILDGIKGILDSGIDFGTSLLNAMIGAWNWLVNKANSMWNNIEVKIPYIGKSVGLPDDTLMALNIAPLAKGGIVKHRLGGVPALIGEAGRNEAVIPLPSGFDLSVLAASIARLDRTTLAARRYAGSHLGGSAGEFGTASLAGGSSSRGQRTLNFYGDLSFPSVKSGDDAESFIRNLESLVN